VYAAIATIAATAVLGVVGVAGARTTAQEHVLHAPVTPTWEPSKNITIQTGDTVRWTFDPGGFHNVQSKDTAETTAWSPSIPDDNPRTNHPDVTYTFSAAGVYAFYCDAHPGAMDGTITVQDEPVTPTPDPTTSPTPSPSPSPSASPSPSPSASPQPGGGHAITPPPTGGSDTIKPTVSGVKLNALRHAIRVRFRLSEPATVTLRVNRARKAVKSARIQAAAGRRSVTLRSKRFKKGRYTVGVEARDAFGNRSAWATKRLAVRR
jgi:plastocyanin